MRGVERLGAAAAGTALGLGSLWLAYRNLSRPGSAADWVFWVPITLLLVTLATFGWWFALRSDRAASRAGMWASWKGGLWVGGSCFALGFVGPLLIWPDASLGPLLGILVTGPLGFVSGVLGILGIRAAKPSQGAGFRKG